MCCHVFSVARMACKKILGPRFSQRILMDSCISVDVFFSVLADGYQMLPACLLFAALAIQVLHETYPFRWHENYLEVAFEWKKARLMSNFVWTPEDNWSFQMCNACWISLDISGSAFLHFSMITLWSLRLRRKGFRESGHRMHREVSWKKNMLMSWRKWR